jgi:hypothetical protein
MSMENHGGTILAGETRRIWRKTCPNATSTKKTAWSDPEANPGIRGERPATERLSHGTALYIRYYATHRVGTRLKQGKCFI